MLAVEDVLAEPEFGVEGGESSADQMGTEIGDQPNRVREFDAVGESRPPLVVDEQEVHPCRAVRGRHADDPCLQELALARACGASDQGMRALAPEVEVEGLPGCGAHPGAKRAESPW
jgi:hypothetical protein